MTDTTHDEQLDTNDASMEAAPLPEENLLPQSEVNKLVGTVKNTAFNKGYEKGLNEIREKYNQPNVSGETNSNSSYMQNSNALPDHYKEMIQAEIRAAQEKQYEEAQQAGARQEADRLLQELQNKSQVGRQKYSDFDDKLKEIGYFESASEILPLLNAVDNTADLMYDLAQNPTKISNILAWVNRNPTIAYNEIKKLSNSIKANEAGKNTQLSPEPFSQLKSSNVGMDNGAQTLADFKQRFRG